MDLARYQRQTRFAPLGDEGQRKLLASRVLICGCGALGTVQANLLARAGVGKLRIVDRDFVDLTNLQRQVLFEEGDIASGLPKAVAAAERLRRINSTIEIEPIVADVGHQNIHALTAGVDLILDATDNFETRFLLNDASLSFGIPWIYAGCLGAEGQMLVVLPKETACLRCLIREAPAPGTSPTCDTAGILASATSIMASWQVLEAIKILSGHREAVLRSLLAIDLWDNRIRQINLSALFAAGDCPACGNHPEFPWLAGARGQQPTVLCGRNAVQLAGAESHTLNLEDLEAKLAPLGQVRRNAYLLRFVVDTFQLTIFPDGRAIIVGTEDIPLARSLYARYIGT